MFIASRTAERRKWLKYFCCRELLGHQGRHVGWKGLRRRELLSLGPTLRHRAFFHRPDWLAGITVEHEQKSLLGRLDHDVAHSLPGVYSRQRRLRRQIVVPYVVMHGLIRPHQFTGIGTERHDGIGVFVVAGPLPAPEVRARRRGGQENKPAILVRGHRRPDISVACGDPAMHERIPSPALLPRVGVKGTHRSERRIYTAIVRY